MGLELRAVPGDSAAMEAQIAEVKQMATTAKATGDNARQMVLNRDPTLTTLQDAITALQQLASSVTSLSAESTADRAGLHTSMIAAQASIAALQAKVDALTPGVITAVGSTTLSAILLGASLDVPITLSRTMPSATYSVTPIKLNGVTLTVKSKTTTSVTITVTAGLAIAAGTTLIVYAST